MSLVHHLENSYSSSENSDTYYGLLNGASCTNAQVFYETIAEIFQFPSYFGKNLDALDEMLDDLDWLENEYKVLIILNNQEFLKDDLEFKESLMNLILDLPNDTFECIVL